MIIRALLFMTIAFALAACAAPRSADELKSAAEGTSLAQIEHFSIKKGGLKDVKARLREYGERCLSRDAIAERCGAFSCSHYTYANFTPKFETIAHGIRFVLQRKQNGGIQLSKMPEDGMYVMVAEAETSSGQLQGHIWGAKYGYGDIIGSTKGWMTGEKKICPDL